MPLAIAPPPAFDDGTAALLLDFAIDCDDWEFGVIVVVLGLGMGMGMGMGLVNPPDFDEDLWAIDFAGCRGIRPVITEIRNRDKFSSFNRFFSVKSAILLPEVGDRSVGPE